MKFGLTEETIQQINRVFEQYPSIEMVLIYGSRAKGNHKVGSDIDLTLMDSTISHQNFLKICSQLDELPIPYMIDLSIFSHIENPDLRDHIQRIGKTFYTRNNT